MTESSWWGASLGRVLGVGPVTGFKISSNFTLQDKKDKGATNLPQFATSATTDAESVCGRPR